MSLICIFETHPVDISGTVVGESPDCLLLSGTVVGENPDHVCWALTEVHYLRKNILSSGLPLRRA